MRKGHKTEAELIAAIEADVVHTFQILGKTLVLLGFMLLRRKLSAGRK